MPAQPYKPDPLADTGQRQTPFGEKISSGSGIVSTLLRLAMRRMPAMGYGANKSTQGVKPPTNAFTAGSHGKIA